MYVYITSLKTNKTGPREKLYKRHDSLVILYSETMGLRTVRILQS